MGKNTFEKGDTVSVTVNAGLPTEEIFRGEVEGKAYSTGCYPITGLPKRFYELTLRNYSNAVVYIPVSYLGLVKKGDPGILREGTELKITVGAPGAYTHYYGLLDEDAHKDSYAFKVKCLPKEFYRGTGRIKSLETETILGSCISVSKK